MKKLIDELQAGKDFTDEIFNDTPVGKALKEGFEAAFNIVRAHNPWHEVAELPPVCEQEPDFSIDVLLTDGERCRVGYYAFSTGSWILHRYFKNPVTGWAYLPEGKP